MVATLRTVLTVEDAAPRRSREAFAGWLRDVCLARPCETVDDVVLAVSEAVSNAAEHAYPDSGSGSITVVAEMVEPARTIQVSVVDRGSWRTPPVDPGLRGRGLRLMHALTDSVVVTHPGQGTTVVLRRQLRCVA